jgi:hypothetical protein
MNIRKLVQRLEKIESKYILYHHEDMFLYRQPDWEKIEQYINFMEKEDFDSIRLIKSGEMRGAAVSNDLIKIPERSNHNFVLQPTIIKTEKMIELFNNSKKTNIWDFEVDVQRVCQDINLRSCYANTSNKRIGYHYESNVYPYIATGIVKGKWNYSEYPDVLQKIFKHYDIDRSIRGCR